MFVIMACETQQDVQNAGNSSVVLAVVDSPGVDVRDSNLILYLLVWNKFP
jgi:hypothetical protein